MTPFIRTAEFNDPSSLFICLSTLPSPVALKLDEVVREVFVQPSVGDVPQLHGAILRRGGDYVVVERVPLYVQNLSAVSGYLKNRHNLPNVHSGIR